jgi:hypothetical protein
MVGEFVAWSKRKNSPGWIENERGCHIWTGKRNEHGYGRVTISNRQYFIHRVRYEREVGPIPPGLQLDHFACNNGPGGCCNPAHCEPVTSHENTLRGLAARGRPVGSATHCPKGHPLSGDNLRRFQLKRGIRSCRTCENERQRGRRRVSGSVFRKAVGRAAREIVRRAERGTLHHKQVASIIDAHLSSKAESPDMQHPGR